MSKNLHDPDPKMKKLTQPMHVKSHHPKTDPLKNSKPHLLKTCICDPTPSRTNRTENQDSGKLRQVKGDEDDLLGMEWTGSTLGNFEPWKGSDRPREEGDRKMEKLVFWSFFKNQVKDSQKILIFVEKNAIVRH